MRHSGRLGRCPVYESSPTEIKTPDHQIYTVAVTLRGSSSYSFALANEHCSSPRSHQNPSHGRDDTLKESSGTPMQCLQVHVEYIVSYDAILIFINLSQNISSVRLDEIKQHCKSNENKKHDTIRYN